MNFWTKSGAASVKGVNFLHFDIFDELHIANSAIFQTFFDISFFNFSGKVR